jgi:hypothetical protein
MSSRTAQCCSQTSSPSSPTTPPLVYSALLAWVAIVGIVVWLSEKAVEKFRRRLSRTPTQTDASVSSVAALEPASAGEQASARRKPTGEPEAAE